MSMSYALEYCQEWFRSKYGWKINECGVQHDTLPPANSGPFYVGIDDGGVETGNESTDSLKEILTITIGIWKRPEHLRGDLRGKIKLPNDIYLASTWTLHDLERAVVVHKTVGGVSTDTKHGLHNNWEFVRGLNTRYNLPDLVNGAEFRFPFVYRGRGRMESIAIPNTTDADAFMGYRLRFRGLAREQKMRSTDDAIG